MEDSVLAAGPGRNPARRRKVSRTSEQLARTAEMLATTMEYSAVLYDSIVRDRPEAHEHATRLRRLAAAERASAAALRNGEVPSDELRQVIRGRGDSTDGQDGT